MPFKSYAEKEQAKLVVKEAAAQQKLSYGFCFDPITFTPLCALGHIQVGLRPESRKANYAAHTGGTVGLDRNESSRIAAINDMTIFEWREFKRSAGDVEPILKVIDQIPVGGE